MKITYFHPVFGMGYEIIKELEDGYCYLRKGNRVCGAYREFLIEDSKFHEDEDSE